MVLNDTLYCNDDPEIMRVKNRVKTKKKVVKKTETNGYISKAFFIFFFRV